MEAEDQDVVETALREAQEEIGLALPSSMLKVLNTLTPFLSKNLLYVVPVVAFAHMDSEDLVNSFHANVAEVSSVWSWPLRDFLGLQDNESQKNLAVRHGHRDVTWLHGKKYRLHEFCNAAMASPVTGLTADIVLETALMAFGKDKPGFESKALGQLSNMEMVEAVLGGEAGLYGDTRSSIGKARVIEDTVNGGSQ